MQNHLANSDDHPRVFTGHAELPLRFPVGPENLQSRQQTTPTMSNSINSVSRKQSLSGSGSFPPDRAPSRPGLLRTGLTQRYWTGESQCIQCDARVEAAAIA